MGNVDALKELYAAMGGDPAAVAEISTNAEMILAIAEQVPQMAASILPAVTAADNGKVLKVTDGEWGVGTDAT